MTASSTHFDVLAAITRANGLLLRADATGFGLEHELRHAFARGQVLRLRYGVYVSAQWWRPSTRPNVTCVVSGPTQ